MPDLTSDPNAESKPLNKKNVQRERSPFLAFEKQFLFQLLWSLQSNKKFLKAIFSVQRGCSKRALVCPLDGNANHFRCIVACLRDMIVKNKVYILKLIEVLIKTQCMHIDQIFKKNFIPAMHKCCVLVRF